MANEQRRPSDSNTPNRGQTGNVGNPGSGPGRHSDRDPKHQEGGMNREPDRNREGGMGQGNRQRSNMDRDIEE